MKRILILGASLLQLPAIRRAREMGLYTIVADYDPRAVGIPYADEYHCVSTIDADGITRLARETHADGLMTLATDMPMRAIAAATTALHLPGITPQTALQATDKGEMIRAFEREGVAHPWYHIVRDESELRALLPRLTYPLVMKPTDNAGNRGVCYINSRDELLQEYAYSRENAREGRVILEEYMEGEEVSVEVIVYRGQVHILAVTDKLTLGRPYFVEVGHAEPSEKDAATLAAIRRLTERAVKAVGIDNSPAHVEIMVTPTGPKMVELGARMGGDCITTHLVPLSTGIDMIEATLRLALGEEPDLTPKRSRGAALRHITGVEGRITAIEGVERARQMEGVVEVDMMKGVGDTARYFMNGTDRVGFVIATAPTTAEAIRRCEEAIKEIHITTTAL